MILFDLLLELARFDFTVSPLSCFNNVIEGGVRMPSQFKSLATIAAWVLFIFGLLRLLIGLITAFSGGPALAPTQVYLDFAIGISSITLSVVVMKLRKMLE